MGRPLGVVAVALIALMAGLWMAPGWRMWGVNEALATEAPPGRLRVNVAAVLERQTALWTDFSGRVEARDSVEIRSRVAGQVQALHFVEGALVKKGDLLISLDSAPFEAEVERANAQVAAARARDAFSRIELDRAVRLSRDQAVAQREVDERRNAADEAQAQLQSALAVLRLARLNLSYTQIRAPVAGRTGRLEVSPGNLVGSGPGAPVLTTLVSVSPVRVTFQADERTMLDALAGLSGDRRSMQQIPVQVWMASITGSQGAPRPARLQLIDNRIDATSGTVRVRAELDNTDGSLIPGQFARVSLGQPPRGPLLLIQERAVGVDQDKRFVYVVQEDGSVAYRQVVLGASTEGMRVVTSGLRTGERIVVNGLHLIRPGAVIEPKLVPMELSQQ